MNAPTLLLLPGNMCDARLWGRICGVDGVHADLSRDDSIEKMAQRLLFEHQGPLISIGFSMGGIVALEMARQAPERILGLILSDTNAGADLPERAALRPAQQDRVRNGDLATIVADDVVSMWSLILRLSAISCNPISSPFSSNSD